MNFGACQEWLAQKDVDWLLSDQIATLYCIATMLKDLHSKELVLCDLSPTTIAWSALPTLNSQRLPDGFVNERRCKTPRMSPGLTSAAALGLARERFG